MRRLTVARVTWPLREPFGFAIAAISARTTAMIAMPIAHHAAQRSVVNATGSAIHPILYAGPERPIASAQSAARNSATRARGWIMTWLEPDQQSGGAQCATRL